MIKLQIYLIQIRIKYYKIHHHINPLINSFYIKNKIL